MRSVWRVPYEFYVEQLGSNNVFAFHFRSEDDRLRVFSGGPWSFGGQPISLVKPKGIREIDRMDFYQVSFWIQILNVPIACMTNDCAVFLGKLIGDLEDVEIKCAWMRVRVKIDVRKPLQRGVRVEMEELNREVSLLLQYEHLPEFCFGCGIIGHRARECTRTTNDDPGYLASEKRRYRAWMRATVPLLQSREREGFSTPRKSRDKYFTKSSSRSFREVVSDESGSDGDGDIHPGERRELEEELAISLARRPRVISDTETVQIPVIEKISSAVTTASANSGTADVVGQRHLTQILEDDSLISWDIMLIDPSKQLDSNLEEFNVAQSEEQSSKDHLFQKERDQR
ncbi:Zinc knuckle CX2CX4HX4C [Parasponia andersonii]|uniref:Zinc knuckle CX2CX4HX4C n=1 Tax=Parasponia andersonii TaxID=3476 RepID=A0A2P5AZS2_PARAD|nr:Zinc knuckle CX2CX4HX4C [Parasponia andersonii]